MSNPLTNVAVNGPFTTNSTFPTFQNIPGMSLSADAAVGDQFLVTLTVPDTWNDTAGGRGWFAITYAFGSNPPNIIAQGLFSCAMANQRMPITIQTVVAAAQTGSHHFAAQFCREVSGVVYIGGWSKSDLSLLRVS